jgi:hypothetical protein
MREDEGKNEGEYSEKLTRVRRSKVKGGHSMAYKHFLPSVFTTASRFLSSFCCTQHGSA